MINYYLLTKPGIILGNLITFAAGFLLASRGQFDFWLFFSALMGLGLTMASACVFNNYIDKPIDKKMERTKKRPLVQGLVSGKNAILFALILGIFGNIILLLFTNFLALLITDVGFFVYVVLYSLWKSHTVYGTAIGSIAGAIPPVVGYSTVSNQLDIGALLLFLMLVLWQMPHFFSIALLHLDDYKAAKIPVLPIEKGILRTQIHMVLYIMGFIFVTMLLTVFHYTGYWYLVVSTVLGLLWLGLCLIGFKRKDTQLWGRDMFRLSLLVMMGICFFLPFDLQN